MHNPDPKSTFYLKVNEARSDGTLDFDLEIPECFASLEEAVEAGKEQASELRGDSWIYECKPVRAISHGKVQVKKLS